LFDGFEGVGHDEPDGGGVAAKQFGEHGSARGRAHAGVFRSRGKVRDVRRLSHEKGCQGGSGKRERQRREEIRAAAKKGKRDLKLFYTAESLHRTAS
jgi:hypothetical protein